MDPTLVMTQVSRVLEERCGIREEDIATSSSLDDLGIDSIVAAELLVELEDVLECELELDGLEGLETVGDVLAALLGASASDSGGEHKQARG